MQKFQELLTEAAQLKQQQLKQQRKNFQALPQYLKSGLNYAKKYTQLRKQHYLLQIYISQSLKKQGNDQYLLQNYGQALSKYQQALSIFRYIHATKYQNLKDEDIIYQNYVPSQQNKQEHQTHLVALYLNICSALTKMNKKDEAIHSSEQALKLNSTNPKIFYKKAQAYLQYINRQTQDIKVGFYYLNKAYEFSKDQSILVQMHKIKKQLDEQRKSQKKWFKFMFDKNKECKQQQKQQNRIKQVKNQKQLQNKQNNKQFQYNPQNKQVRQRIQKANENEQKNKMNSDVKNLINQIKNRYQTQAESIQIQKSDQSIQQNKHKQSFKDNEKQKRNRKMKEQFQKFKLENQQAQTRNVSQRQTLQKTKLNLKPYLIIPRDDRWLIKYQEDFIHKHGSKIYSVLQLYNYSQYLIQFKALLAKCLQLKVVKITAERNQDKLLQEKITMYDKFVQWIKKHPIQKYKKYIQRYDLQTQWIKQNRGKSLDEIFDKNQKLQIKPQGLTSKKQVLSNKYKKPYDAYSSTNTNKDQNNNQYKDRLQQFMESVRQCNKNPKNNIQDTNYEQNRQQNKFKRVDTKEDKKHKLYDHGEQIFEKQQPIQRKLNQKIQSQNKKLKYKRNYNTYGFKEQWQCNEQNEAENKTKKDKNFHQVPASLKGFLQNYEDFPGSNQGKRKQKSHKKFDQRENLYLKNGHKQKINTKMQAQNQEIKQNPFGFVKTFVVIIIFTLIAKLIF